jgi:hypothetical protein
MDGGGIEGGAARAEDLDVGVSEAVDGLRLVADGEQVVALQRLENVELQAVRVLELVDHDQREAGGPARAQGRVRGEQIAHAQLEVSKSTPARAALAAAYSAPKVWSRPSSRTSAGRAWWSAQAARSSAQASR